MGGVAFSLDASRAGFWLSHAVCRRAVIEESIPTQSIGMRSLPRVNRLRWISWRAQMHSMPNCLQDGMPIGHKSIPA